MGSFTFKWEHPDANNVYVTGTFDSWTKSEKLEKKGSGFEKTVTLPNASEKILYKFVVDGTWCTDPTAPLEYDHEGNPNNVLTPERITKHTIPAAVGMMSSVAPTSTAYELSKDVPLEKSNGSAANGSTDVPGAFPETPATEPQSFSVNPIPATSGAGNPVHLAPGEAVPDPSTLTSNNVSSTVHDDMTLAKSADNPEQTFGISPIPATAGGGNPVHIGAGEGLPTHSAITGNTIQSTVRTDQASYEASDAGPPVLPAVVTPQAEREKTGMGILGMPPISRNMIPESSLPMGAGAMGVMDANPTIQSSGPHSTTAQLAANVPLEPKVPEVVKESQTEAGADPEASAVPEEVREKSEVEKQLLSEVPKAPVTSDDTTVAVKSAGATAMETGAAVGAAAMAVGGAAAAYAYSAKDQVAEGLGQASNSGAVKTATSYATGAKDKVVAAAGLGQTNSSSTNAAAPEVVRESIAESGQSPEAAAYAEPVAEKKVMEKELLSEVKPETSTGEPAPVIGGGAMSAPAATTGTAAPEIVRESIAESGMSPEAAAYSEPVAEKKAMEKELLSEVKPETIMGQPAPKMAMGTLSPAVETPTLDSRDISPTTVPGSHKQTTPAVTSGVASGTTETTSAAPITPSKPTTTTASGSSKMADSSTDSPAESSTATKKKNRISGFFGKVKSTFSNKDKA